MSKIYIEDYYRSRGLLGDSLCPKKFNIDLEGECLETALNSQFPRGLELSESELRIKFKTDGVWAQFDPLWGDNIINSLVINPSENVGAFSATHCRGYSGGGGRNFHAIYGVSQKEGRAYGNLLFHEKCKLNMKARYLFAKILSVDSTEVRATLMEGHKEKTSVCLSMQEDLQ